ncbi:MAG TPA: hypothetical protein ENH55_06925 [Aurantimonas coralicida]|uniref:DUF5330 domain-containing protein n=2 Tax=root TaxID=1 RepID=A0A9C9TGH5_9HYPH|nr:hypothetical protein [Aurantimonas coralicida]HET99747.1 hypothetical protein [Aurantimonas coralicida]
MIRFILKSAFLLGIVAMLLPGDGQGDDAGRNQVDVFSTFVGAQAAIADLSNFCDRAPAACDAGGNLARFAGERIGDGIALAYNFVEAERDGSPASGNSAASSLSRYPDAIVTGAVDRALSLASSRATEASQPVGMPRLDDPANARHVLLPSAEIPGHGALARLPIPRSAPRT